MPESARCPGFVRRLSGLPSGIGSMVVRCRSAVGFAAVSDGGDRDRSEPGRLELVFDSEHS
jgi:hypothetical protein